MGTDPPFRYLTVSLHVEHLLPTPIDEMLEIRSRVKGFKGRKIVVATTLLAGGKIRARGEVVAVQVPDH